MSRYSLKRRDKKLAGVASSLGDVFNIDPTFLRISFVLAFFFISWEVAVVAYVAAGIYLHLKKNKALPSDDRRSDFDRMDDVGKGRTSIHDLRTTLDASDRRMMAIDHHLNRQNDDLAREIEALRGDTK
jgi:phage shock protein PspC (stress-responsive transcriptional regulator)